MTDNRGAWTAFLETYGPRPKGREAQTAWESEWLPFQREYIKRHDAPYPPFDHAPAPHRHTRIEYNNRTYGNEYNFGNDWPDTDAIREARSAAFVNGFKRVVVRAPSGAIIFDGPSHRIYE